MKLIAKTWEYLFVLERGKRFAILFAAALPFGLACALALDAVSVMGWMSSPEAAGDFGTVWLAGTAVGPSAVWHTVAVLLMVPTLAFLSGYISRSMRTGVFRAQWLGKAINDAFFPALGVSVAYAFLYLLARLFTTLFWLLWHGVAGAAWLASTLSGISLALIALGFAAIPTQHIFYLPLMVINGIHPVRAFVRAFGNQKYKKRVIIPAITLPILVAAAAGMLVGLSGIRWLGVVVDALLMALLAVYLTAAAFVGYCDLEGLERADYTREYYYRKIK